MVQMAWEVVMPRKGRQHISTALPWGNLDVSHEHLSHPKDGPLRGWNQRGQSQGAGYSHPHTYEGHSQGTPSQEQGGHDYCQDHSQMSQDMQGAGDWKPEFDRIKDALAKHSEKDFFQSLVTKDTEGHPDRDKGWSSCA